MNVYPGRPFYNSIVNFGKVDVNPPKHQEVGEVVSVPREIVHVEGERFWYCSGAEPTKTDGTVNAVHYSSTPNRLEQLVKHEVVNEKDEEIVKKNGKEDVYLPARFNHHQPAFFGNARRT